ncbi:MAG: hypothetical protein MUF22_04400 [Chitinispirillaceae bacterium]|nr:hypothetical protein [Chitinispirillaceae bacterium]
MYVQSRPKTRIVAKLKAYGAARYVLAAGSTKDTALSYVTRLRPLGDTVSTDRTIGRSGIVEFFPLVDGQYLFSAYAVDSRGLRDSRTVTDTLTISGATTHTFYGDSLSWQMVSVPAWRMGADTLKGSGYVVIWDESSPERDIYGYYTPSREIGSIDNGRSYWLKTPDTLDITIAREALVDTIATLKISKAKFGWNQIANPFPYTVQWTRSEQLWKWNDSLRDYEQSGNILEPWQGYWLMADSAATITVEPKPFFADSNRLAKRRAKTLFVDRSEWCIALSLEGRGVSDRENLFGMSKTASDGYDRNDKYEPPRMTGANSSGYLFFPHPEWKQSGSRFASDIRRNWQELNAFEVGVSPWEGSDSARILIDGYESLQSIYVFVRDESGLREYDPAAGIALGASAKTRYITFFATGDRDFAKQLPLKFACENPFPNPCRSAARIKYTLPYEWLPDGRLALNEYEVKISLYDLAGRQVRNIVNRKQKPGRYLAVWDGKMNTGRMVSAGMYLMTVQAGRYLMTVQAGRYSSIRPVTVVR